MYFYHSSDIIKKEGVSKVCHCGLDPQSHKKRTLDSQKIAGQARSNDKSLFSTFDTPSIVLFS